MGDEFQFKNIYYTRISETEAAMGRQSKVSTSKRHATEAESLPSLIIPNSVSDSDGKTYTVKTVLAFSFYECIIQSLMIPESIISFGDSAFDRCQIISLNFPQTVEIIGTYSFSSCRFKYVMIPFSVRSIGYGAFGYNPNLESITVDGKNMYYSTSEDHHILFNFMKTTLILIAPKNMMSINIPNTVHEVATDAFIGYPLSKLVLPNSVEIYHYRSLGVNKNLSKVIIQGNIIYYHRDFLYHYTGDSSISEIWYYGTRVVENANLTFFKNPPKVYVCKHYNSKKFGTASVTRTVEKCPLINSDKTCLCFIKQIPHFAFSLILILCMKL